MKKVDSKEPVNRGVLDEAVDAILKGMERMFAEQEEHFNKLEAGQKDLQHQINDLKYGTPTQKEFAEVKAKVDKYHPLT
jgi:cell division protein FtsB